MADEWDRIRELADRQERGEGPGKDATKREQHVYELIEQLQSNRREPGQAVIALGKPVGDYRFYRL